MAAIASAVAATATQFEDGEASIQAIIVDASVHNAVDETALIAMLQHLCVFVNALEMLHPGNKFVVVLAGRAHTRLVFPECSAKDAASHRQPPGNFRTLLEGCIGEFMETDLNRIASAGRTWWQVAAGLALAFAFVRKTLLSCPALRPRALVLSRHLDSSMQYVPVMNAVFTAQRLSLPIDAVVVDGPASVFLQQAAHLTGGLFLTAAMDGLSQLLISTTLADAFARQHMVMPTAERVDYAAICFCHHREISAGLVCSACLSVFCTFAPRCATCGTRFDFPGSSRGRTASPNASSQPPPLSKATLREPADGGDIVLPGHMLPGGGDGGGDGASPMEL